MKQRHAWFLWVSGIGLMIGAIPIFVSVITWGHVAAYPRVHYLYGLGQIAGFLGNDETKELLIYKACLIHDDLVEVVVQFDSLEESEEVQNNLMFAKKIENVGTYLGPCGGLNTRCTFKVKSSAEQDFREALREAMEIREARKSEEARKAQAARERIRMKEMWEKTPRPLPLAPHNLRLPRIKEAEEGDAPAPATRSETGSEVVDDPQSKSKEYSQ